MLLNHLSRPNLMRHGVHIKAEAVLNQEHSLVMIVDARDEQCVRTAMQPLAQRGAVEVLRASTCTRVVAGGGCEMSLMDVDEPIPCWDPEDVCQDAIDAGLVVHRAHPLNCETSIPALIGGVVMPNAHFYVRNHFQVPRLDPTTWRLNVGGRVERPLSLSLRELRAMPSQTAVVTLECAGNGRSLLQPPVDGERWDVGAVSTAEWTGVPLAEVLDRAGIAADAREVLFRGADGGTVEASQEMVHFERSLTVEDALHEKTLLAYVMNGEPLPVQHGYPVRLVVPGWYAVTSVKWLTDIEVVDTPFEGYFQRERYIYDRGNDGTMGGEPVRLQRVRSLITDPGEGEEIDCGDVTVRGVAWSGAAAIARVEVSVGGGPWQDARLVGDVRPHSWRWWELMTRIDRPGTVVLRARATDLGGRTQSEEPDWNRLGYGVNAIHQVAVHCHRRPG
jgi:DMSO/TMAO reductase YedYZ molybdopterin-dependent catalytic subunit